MNLQDYLERSVLGQLLGPKDLEILLQGARERTLRRGEPVFTAGETAAYWYGVQEGICVQNVIHLDGTATYLSAAAKDAWFGEGTLLKNECWKYSAVALRKTRIIMIQRKTFEDLLAQSIAFNRFIQNLLNERLGLFVSLVLSTRHATIESRIASVILDLLNRTVNSDQMVQISQQELAMLAGSTRQRVNAALKALNAAGAVDTLRQGVRVNDIQALKSISAGW